MTQAKQTPNTLLVAIGVIVLIVCVVALCVFAAVFWLFPSEPKTVDDYMREYGGNPDAYDRILSMTDCHLLQDEFDTASANHDRAAFQSPAAQATLGYMMAAENHMHEIGCYK